MRKVIEISEDTKKRLQILAVMAGKDLKNYIQDLLTEYAKENCKVDIPKSKGK